MASPLIILGNKIEARRKYKREWYAKNPERQKDYDQKWREKNPEQYRATQARSDAKRSEKKKAWKRGSEGYKRTERERIRETRRTRRLAAIDALGGKCCKCDFSDERALQFDHKTPLMRRENGLRNHGGCLQPSEFKAIIAGDPHDIQLLCANCHAIKSRTEDHIHIKQLKGKMQ